MAPATCEAVGVESACCTLRLCFPASAPLGELTGIVVANQRATEVGLAERAQRQLAVLDAQEEEFFYGPADFQVAPRPEEEAVEVTLRHNCLLPDSEYSFVVYCVYNELRITPPVVVNAVRTPSEAIPQAAGDEGDKLSVIYHCCCYAGLAQTEAEIDLSTHELVVLSVDREARAIALLSPTYAFNRVIPLRSVCDVRLVAQDERRGALVTVAFPYGVNGSS